MPDDPTMATFAKLKDPTQWRVVSGVPIFKCFPKQKLKQGDGFVEIEVTDRDLYEICANYQRRMDDTATVGRITPGHINPLAPETQQPPIYGHPMNLRVGGWGPKNELAILCDLYVKPEHFEDFKRYPYRSPEYYHDRHEITGVALLIRDPKLDLGMLSFSGRPGCFYFAQETEQESPRTVAPATFDSEEPPIDPTQPPQAEPTMEGAPDEQMPDELNGVPQDWHQHFMRCMKHYAPTSFSAMGFPSGTNGSMPAPARDGATHMADDKKPVTPETKPTSTPEPEAVRMAREQQALQFAQQEQAITELRTQLAEERRLRERADIERQLVQFQGENIGICFERATELERMVAMTGEQRGKHLQYMRDFYKRDLGVELTQDPRHQTMLQTPDSPVLFGDADEKLEFQEAQLALQFQRQNPELDWEACMKKAKEQRAAKKSA